MHGFQEERKCQLCYRSLLPKGQIPDWGFIGLIFAIIKEMASAAFIGTAALSNSAVDYCSTLVFKFLSINIRVSAASFAFVCFVLIAFLSLIC
jgi:hypothetical protein